METCFECGYSADLYDHHVVPVSMGGTRTLKLCGKCHGKVHSHPGLSIRARTKAVLKSKKARGERVGTVPYGYQVSLDGRMLEENPTEGALVCQIQEMRSQGLSLRSVADTLNRSGVTTRKGGKWYHSNIQSMLNTISSVQTPDVLVSKC